MEKEKVDVEEKKLDALLAEAELEAAADEVASVSREDDADKEDEKEESNRFLVELTKEYDFEEKKYNSIDLSGLVDLTTNDLELFDRVLIRLNHRPQNKYQDATYVKHVAMKVTNLPVEFFNMLNARDMLMIIGITHSYFLFG